MKNHLTLGIYSNKSYKYNVVRDEDLENYMAYNKALRPGRLIYVDGKRVYDGVLKQGCLAEFDAVAEKFYENSSSINMNIPTIPYE